jgi:hypothetical protein
MHNPLSPLQLEQDNQTLTSLVDFLSRLVDLAVSTPRTPPLPESPARSEGEGGGTGAPALSLEILQWEQLRVDHSLIVHIASSSAKFVQLEASAADAAAREHDARARGTELKEECERLRVQGG